MNELLQRIDLLFAEDAVPLDQKGRLRHAAWVLERFDPRLLFLAHADGRLIAVYDGGRGDDLSKTPALARELTGLLGDRSLQVSRRQDGRYPLSAFNLRLTNTDGVILGGLLGVPETSVRELDDLRPALEACGSLAWEVYDAEGHTAYLATRIRHLTAEQDTVKMAHRDSAAAVIDEREARIREQRDYVVHLEQEVENRSSALREAMQRAEDANRSKSEFLANVSHELRTPMTAILGFTELLFEAGLSELDRAKAVRTIHSNGAHLLEIINDILDLSKVEAGKMPVEQAPCSPAQIISDVMASVAIRAQAKNLTLSSEYDGPVSDTIRSDRTRLRQILINVVGNAVKFTAAGSVRLITRLLTTEGRTPLLQCEVVDTGIGMTRKEMDSIFEPFSQGDNSTTRRFGGTGLGLALAKRLANMLGGDIVLVESAPGAGTRVRVTVDTGPLDGVRMTADASISPEASAQVAAPSPQDTAPIAGCRVLLAEDSPDSQHLISYVLRNAGAEVMVVGNGRQVLAEVLTVGEQGMPFDVILMDMQMPIMDGYQATQRLRSTGYTGWIVALTAHAMAGDREKCLDAGCDGYATKPINRHSLIETVQSLLSSRGTSRPPKQSPA